MKMVIDEVDETHTTVKIPLLDSFKAKTFLFAYMGHFTTDK